MSQPPGAGPVGLAFVAPRLPANEPERLAALGRYEVLDTPPEPSFDELTALAAELLSVPTALVSLVDSSRQWFKSRFGFSVAETSREVSFCGHVVAEGSPLVVSDAARDPRFRENPCVVGEPRIRFYAGVPLTTADGHVLGTLCVIDYRPRVLQHRDLRTLETLARQVMTQLELRLQLRGRAEAEARLRASLEWQRLLLDLLPDLYFCISSDDRFTDFHGGPGDDLISPKESFLGRPVSEVLPPALASSALSALAEARRTGALQKLDYELTLGGTRRCYEARIVAAPSGDCFVLSRNVTERAESQARLASAHAELSRSHDHLRLVLDGLEVGSLVVAGNGEVLFLSDHGARLLGREEPVAPGTRWEQLLGLAADDARRLRQEIEAGPEGRRRLAVRLRGGEGERTVEVDVLDDPRDEGYRLLFLRDVTEMRRLEARAAAVRRGDIVGASPAMEAMFRQIEDVSRGDWTVLIEGETGTGKDLVARAIHSGSRRHGKPFLAVNCAALTESLMTSQLFGHRRGAFTGAQADQKGFFEAASGGTLLLDEIGDMPLSVQTGLLRVLEQKEVIRLGDARPIKVDVRVLAATHRDLSAEVAAGRFREDLFYRIRVARVKVPPLRERVGDVPLLVSHLLSEAAQVGRAARVDARAMALLEAYAWPGNVRELRNVIDYALMHCRNGTIRPSVLPPELLGKAGSGRGARLEPLSREEIAEAIERAGGRRTQAAALVGVSRATFYRRLKELGMTA